MEALSVGEHSYSEATSYFPKLQHGGAREHLMWVEKTRKAVRLPLIASLNAVSAGGWTEYARQLAGTGVDGIELNVYAVAADPRKTGAEIEQELYQMVEAVRAEIRLPLAVKLSPFYTATFNVAAELDRRGVNALVLFNRFLQPDIDPDGESLHNEMVYSTPAELKLPLRWAALLHGRIRADLAVTSGVHSGGAQPSAAGVRRERLASRSFRTGSTSRPCASLRRGWESTGTGARRISVASSARRRPTTRSSSNGPSM
jgi:dihydroorotate dehydrogenase (fumarate)